jgi:hypothetical protein
METKTAPQYAELFFVFSTTSELSAVYYRDRCELDRPVERFPLERSFRPAP